MGNKLPPAAATRSADSGDEIKRKPNHNFNTAVAGKLLEKKKVLHSLPPLHECRRRFIKDITPRRTALFFDRYYDCQLLPDASPTVKTRNEVIMDELWMCQLKRELRVLAFAAPFFLFFYCPG